MIETLTDEEREWVQRRGSYPSVKALRILDAQSARIADLESERDQYDDDRCAGSLRIVELERELAEARAEVEALNDMVTSYKDDVVKLRNLNSAAYRQLAAANALLEECAHGSRHADLHKRVLAHLSSQPAAPDPTLYEVWSGTEKTKELLIKETTDIEDAARTACADLSGCTFWGMKSQPAAPDSGTRS